MDRHYYELHSYNGSLGLLCLLPGLSFKFRELIPIEHDNQYHSRQRIEQQLDIRNHKTIVC